MFPHNLKGYREAKVPMWPVVSSEHETMRVIAWSTMANAVIIFLIACFIQTNLVIRFLIGAISAGLIVLVIEDLIEPSQKKTFRIFKFASMFMVLGFLLLYLGVIF
jgi:heme O synthase-like polyprenyltransferase